MKILFKHIPYGSPIKSYYSQPIVGLAEGLLELKIEFFGNCNFWFNTEDNEYLIKQAPNDYEPDIEIHSIGYFIENKSSIRFRRGILFVLIDDSDGNDDYIGDSTYLQYNFILKCHYNSIKKFPNKIKPWMFGLTNRIISLNGCFAHTKPERKVYINHRFAHGIREFMSPKVEKFLASSFEIDKSQTESIEGNANFEFPHYWAQSGRRHNGEYFKKLNESLLTFCFGGNFQSIIFPSHYYKFLSFYDKFSFARPIIKKIVYVSQFDSFRFWEALCSNSTPLHLDFDYWGMQFPVQPIAGKHYIGVKDIDFRYSAEQLNSSNNKELEMIAKDGKEWALENYRPICQAKYLFSYIN